MDRCFIQATADLYVLPLPADVDRFAGHQLQELARLRLGSGFSIQELADLIGQDRKVARYLSTESRQPSLATYLDICAATGVPLGSMIRGLAFGPVQPRPRDNVPGDRP